MAMTPDRLFLGQFLLTPSLTELRQDYRIPNPSYQLFTPKKEFYYDGFRLYREYTALFDNYLLVTGGEIESPVHTAFIGLANQYAGIDQAQGDHLERPEVILQHARLRALIANPHFIAAHETAIPVLEALADLPHSSPWHFDMYIPYPTGQDPKHTELKPGFDLPLIEGFTQLIGSDRLWTGKNEDLRRVFFVSVAEGLGRLAERFPVDTLYPRVEMIRRNLAFDPQGQPQPLEGSRPRHTTLGIIDHLGHTFKTAWEKAALRDLAQLNQGREFSQELELVASGGYRLSGLR